jgi:hypothetical protein
VCCSEGGQRGYVCAVVGRNVRERVMMRMVGECEQKGWESQKGGRRVCGGAGGGG